jgi:hypothetical protein
MPDRTNKPSSLAEHMERRATELGKGWKEAAADGGISYEALRLVRDGVTPNPRRLTKRAIELGFRWMPGSFDAIMRGEDPTPVQEAPAPARDSDRAMNEVLALVEQMSPEERAELLTRIVRGAIGVDTTKERQRYGA